MRNARKSTIMGIMTEHTQLIDAIDIRTAVRQYDAEPIDDDQARQLTMLLDAVNLLGDLHLQLIRGFGDVFAEANDEAHFTNARDYLAVVGPKQSNEGRERAGFYAERVALTATLRGWGTCWVAGSWNARQAARHCDIRANEELYLGIVVGRPRDQQSYMASGFDNLTTFQTAHRPSKTYEQVTAGMDDESRQAAPEWFRHGVEAVLKAPSAMNRQPVELSYNAEDDVATAFIDERCRTDGGISPLQYVDLGIAKLHFQIGAGSGTWAWGDGGLFLHR